MILHSITRQLLLSLILFLLILNKTSGQLVYCKIADPCEHGSTCVDQPGTLIGYNCVCTPEYFGINCQSRKHGDIGKINDGSGGNKGNANEASKNQNVLPCLNGGTFIKIGLPCACTHGFGGSVCQFNLKGTYGLNKCLNGGQMLPDETVCSCLPGFAGINCEININLFHINACSSYPCRNNGKCFQSIDSSSFTCSCPSSYFGPRCENFNTNMHRRYYTGFGSILPFLCCLLCVVSCFYFCCFKKRAIGNHPILTRGQNFFNANDNIPIGPHPFYVAQHPFILNNRAPNQGFNTMYTTNTHVPTQNPDEAFKIYNGPPPNYEETIRQPPNKI
jgi:hypothetical protein